MVDDVHPQQPYPNGLYFEGWEQRPEVQPDFNYPLTADHGDRATGVRQVEGDGGLRGRGVGHKFLVLNG
jgi:hypothetical protein